MLIPTCMAPFLFGSLLMALEFYQVRGSFPIVVQQESYRVDSQDDEVIMEEDLAVLRKMFAAENIPEPIPFMYPR